MNVIDSRNQIPPAGLLPVILAVLLQEALLAFHQVLCDPFAQQVGIDSVFLRQPGHQYAWSQRHLDQ